MIASREADIGRQRVRELTAVFLDVLSRRGVSKSVILSSRSPIQGIIVPGNERFFLFVLITGEKIMNQMFN